MGVDYADKYQVGNGLDTADAVYYAGEEFPDTVNVGDVYLYEDYDCPECNGACKNNH